MFFNKNKTKKTLTIHAPVTGTLINLTKVDDPVFAQGMLGNGFAIVPDCEDEKGVNFVAPFTGTLATVFNTGHAYGVKDKTTGVECLIHIGIDTVELAGKGFDIKVKQGNNITEKDIMVTAHLQQIRDEGQKQIVTPLVFTNETMEGYTIKQLVKDNEHITVGQPIAEIVKK